MPQASPLTLPDLYTVAFIVFFFFFLFVVRMLFEYLVLKTYVNCIFHCYLLMLMERNCASAFETTK